MNETASLIFWTDGVDKEKAEELLKKLIAQGFIQSHVTREYNPEFGEPVWYIP